MTYDDLEVVTLDQVREDLNARLGRLELLWADAAIDAAIPKGAPTGADPQRAAQLGIYPGAPQPTDPATGVPFEDYRAKQVENLEAAISAVKAERGKLDKKGSK